MSKDYYNILGVNKGSSDDEIKKAYRKMAMQYHPDRNPGNPEAESKFKEAAEAYDVLSDSQKRSNYDRFGTPDGNGFGGNPFGGFGGNPFGERGHGFSHEDIFSQFGDIFGNGFGRQQQRQQQRGADLRIKISLTIDEILKGCKKKIKYKRQYSCNSCNGKGGTDIKDCIPCGGSGHRTVVQNTPFGQIRQTTTCPDCNGFGKQVKNKCKSCHGDGTQLRDEMVEAEIPAGLSNGMQLNMSGYGNHIKDGVPGNLQIVVEEVREHYFTRENNNIIVEKTVSVIDAIIGSNVKVKTPHGDITVTIEPGTQPGKVIRLNGKGIPDVNYGLGDLFVKISVSIPKNINLEEKSILDKLKASKNFSV